MPDKNARSNVEKFQNMADHTIDTEILFFVELVYTNFKINLKLLLVISFFAWHAAHCLQCVRLDLGRRCAG